MSSTAVAVASGCHPRWCNQIPFNRSTRETLNKVADLLIDVRLVVQSAAYLFAKGFREALAQAVDGGFHRTVRKAEFLGGARITARRRMDGEMGAQVLVELAFALLIKLVFQSLKSDGDHRLAPTLLKTGFGIEVGGEFDVGLVAFLGVHLLKRDKGLAMSSFEGGGLSGGVGEEMFQAAEQVKAKLAFLGVGGLKRAGFDHAGEEGLGKIFRISHPMPMPTDVEVDGIPVGLAQRGQRFIPSERIARQPDGAPLGREKEWRGVVGGGHETRLCSPTTGGRKDELNPWEAAQAD